MYDGSVTIFARYLMGTYEIAEMLGVSRQRAQQIAAHKNFPKPYDVLHAGKIWKRKAVEQWARDHGRVITDDEPPAS
jgi:predicted DNA-binding transcriptional regulator AlpA